MLNKPYIILKYAKSIDNYIGQKNKSIWLTNNYSKRLVHKWRAEVDAILVGSGTVSADNPRLTTRFDFGNSPLRVVLDGSLNLDVNKSVFNNEAKTIVFTKKNNKHQKTKGKIKYFVPNCWTLEEMLSILHREGVRSIIIEGGQKVLKSFVANDLWDEARVLVAKKELFMGLKAPELNCKPMKEFRLLTDTVQIYKNPKLIR